MKRIILALLLILVVPQTQATAQTSDSLRSARLGGLARVWGQVKYFHPSLPSVVVDWDSLLIATIPAIRGARAASVYHNAVRGMLLPLNDALTTVLVDGDSKPPTAANFSYDIGSDSILVVTMGNYVALSALTVQSHLQKALAAFETARAFVLDLRTDTPTDPYGFSMLNGSLNNFERLLTTDTLALPGELRRAYYGYESPGPFSSGQYRTGRFIRGGARLVPARGARLRPTVVVINRHSALTPGLIALQHAGAITVLLESTSGDHSVGGFATLTLADGLQARVRTTTDVFEDSRSTMFWPDVMLPAEDGRPDKPVKVAREMVRHLQPGHRPRKSTPVNAALLPERSYAGMNAPALEYRLLSLFRLWNIVEHFYPYKELLDEDWNGVLEEFIPIFEQAEGERAYNIAVAQLVTRMQDSHSYLAGSGPARHVVASGYPGVRIRMIENQLVVTAVTDSNARNQGVAVGDVLTTVDSEPARDRYERAAALISASTPHDKANKTTLTFLTGPPGSTVSLTVRDRSNRQRRVALARKHEDYTTLYHRERSGDIIRILPGNIGYIDLDRLSYDMLDSAFMQLKNTNGLIFDMRGYPKGLFWAIGPRLTKTAKCAARLHTPMPGHQSPAPATESLCQMIYPSDASPHYAGPTVMLIDERSVSQAEHTGLYFKAANGTRFVGTHTAGADGELATMVLPGGITVGFTGQGVTWPDGRQLQRVGLIPDVPAAPTIAGIRAGRDEVLEAALLVLQPHR